MSDAEVGSVRSSKPLPLSGIYRWSIKVIYGSDISSNIFVGIANNHFPLESQTVGVYNAIESAGFDTKNGTVYCYGAIQFAGMKYGEGMKSGDVLDITWNASRGWLSFGREFWMCVNFLGSKGREYGWIINVLGTNNMYPFVSITGSGSAAVIVNGTQ